MYLSIRQKSNIRHFIYYLVNGTLNFDVLHNKLKGEYHEILKNDPGLFYKACCVFINQECRLNEDWPQTGRIAGFIYDTIKGTEEFSFEAWETDLEIRDNDLNGAFKLFTKWFMHFESQGGGNYSAYIGELATFVETCFSIWSNVVTFNDGKITNADLANARVGSYINSYFTGTPYDIEDWEWELY
jgi:hypothetical protein